MAEAVVVSWGRVCMGQRKPAESWYFANSSLRPGKSWISNLGYGMSWKMNIIALKHGSVSRGTCQGCSI